MPLDAVQGDRSGAEHEAANRENGRQLAAASRTMRPQISTHGRRIVRAGVIMSQAMPRITKSTNCQPTIRPNSGHPTRLTADTTLPKP